jgi:hypothetical protein
MLNPGFFRYRAPGRLYPSAPEMIPGEGIAGAMKTRGLGTDAVETALNSARRPSTRDGQRPYQQLAKTLGTNQQLRRPGPEQLAMVFLGTVMPGPG